MARNLKHTDESLMGRLRSMSQRLRGAYDLDPLMERIGDSNIVLIGEASHGTSEFYTWRARITQRLINEKGFCFVAVEGDWPDTYRLNRYVKGYEDAGNSAQEVLHSFDRWPSWMWANWEVAAFAEWLKKDNSRHSKKVGFYGLDVYSLWESMESVMDYLKKNMPDAVETARQAYRCFEPYAEDVQSYAWSTRLVPDSCENEVIKLLSEIRNNPKKYPSDPEAAFDAEQNALVMVNAEKYYRSMVKSDVNSWNIRDNHMADTLERIIDYYGKGTKCVVWAHNTHIGDGRATDMGNAGMETLGQIIRDRHSDKGVVLIGFGSYKGSVIASDYWGAKMEKITMPEGREGSWEEVLHKTGLGNMLLITDDIKDSAEFQQWRGHRAIGVVYDPDSERYGNYVPTVLPQRYDAFLFLDNTQALHPMHIDSVDKGTPPDTYPWGM